MKMKAISDRKKIPKMAIISTDNSATPAQNRLTPFDNLRNMGECMQMLCEVAA